MPTEDDYEDFRITHSDLPEVAKGMFKAMEHLLQKRPPLPSVRNEWDEVWNRDHSGRNLGG